MGKKKVTRPAGGKANSATHAVSHDPAAQAPPPPQETASPQSTGRASAALPENDPGKRPFVPVDLERTIVAVPLLDSFDRDKPGTIYDIIIDLNLSFPGGRAKAKEQITRLVTEMSLLYGEGLNLRKSKSSQQYLFGRLNRGHVEELVRKDAASVTNSLCSGGGRALKRIWPDFPIGALINKSISTVKADAARNAFAAIGNGIVWAVIDSGVDINHPHFATHENLVLDAPLLHADFTMVWPDDPAGDASSAQEALVDENGHGTHVAGIIAGHTIAGMRPSLTGERRQRVDAQELQIVAQVRQRDETGKVSTLTLRNIQEISGMAPRCKLLSLKVLDKAGRGLASNLLAAIDHIQEINGNGRRIRVHGVNLSVGYDFEPKWYACGQSPLCVEVDRLVKSGVIVVVAAGNTGYGYNQPQFQGPTAAGLGLTINDPGNAELAITVGSTHREAPHKFGVSYFSSKGPTGDGRMKPDLVAPGEKIISCEAGPRVSNIPNAPPPSPAPDAMPLPQTVVQPAALSGALAAPPASPDPAQTGAAPPLNSEAPAPAAVMEVKYKEDSGTSMAAPHVSGVIAAFLSSRREFIGRPEDVKAVFLSTATDLKRVPSFQGRGLVDLMRAIQSV